MPFLGRCLPHFPVVPSISSWDCAAERFLLSLGESSHDKVITCEDKDCSVLWIAQVRLCMLRWIHVLRRSDRWQILELEDDVVVSFYRKHFDKCLPNNLL